MGAAAAAARLDAAGTSRYFGQLDGGPEQPRHPPSVAKRTASRDWLPTDCPQRIYTIEQQVFLPMSPEEVCLLLPCHSLEDFPVHHEAAEAEGLVAAWSALWHPLLIDAVGRLPAWYRADAPPDNLAGRLVVVPAVSESLLLAGWVSRASAEGAHVVRKLTRRDEIVAALLGAANRDAGAVSAELAADFHALGLCYLLVELLTRQMRYMSNVDEVHLQNETVAGARAAVAHDEPDARRHLRNCFEVLTEARERFYPVDSYLVDLTLVASTTIGAALRQELASDVAVNLLMPAAVLEQMARDEPTTLEALRHGLDRGTACLVGGEYDEGPLPLLTPEALLGQLCRGLAACRAVLGQVPVVYGRRRFGLAPNLPGILSGLGFEGALHATLDDGVFPPSPQAKIRWEGLDAGSIDALGRVPLDATRPETFLGLPQKIGESMDLDHVATVVFAHWPGQVSPFYEDLRRIAGYGPVLGKFVCLADYFRHTDSPGEIIRFRADQYRSPYLRQAIIRQEADPVSSHAARLHREMVGWAANALETWVRLIRHGGGDEGRAATSTQSVANTIAGTASIGSTQAGEPADAGMTFHAAAVARWLADAVATASSQREAHGALVINPHSFARAVVVDVPGLASPPEVGGPVVAVQPSGGGHRVVVNVPGMGFTWLGPGRPAAAERGAKPLAEQNVLRNEHMQVVLNATTGGISGIHATSMRGNRLSQQLAFRLPGARRQPGDVWTDPDRDANYSVMVCDELRVVSAGPAVGELEARGRLVDREGKRLAGFRQNVRLPRTSRVVELDIELDVAEVPRADPWNSYYAARFAWADETAEMWRSVSLTSQPTTAKRIEAPWFVELRTERTRTAILTGGCPYHLVTGPRMLDTLLVVRGETCQRFRLGVAIDALHPLDHALNLLGAPLVVPDVAALGGGDCSGWLFHVDARSVVATHWEAIVEGDQVAGFRVRLLETEGKAGRVNLRSLRHVRSARQVNFRGEPLVELTVKEDRILIDLAGYEWVQVEARI